MEPRFLTTAVNFGDKRSFDAFVSVLRLLVPGHDREALSLTLLPPAMTADARVLTVTAHYHRAALEAHWSLALERPPAGPPPDSVRERSDRLGGISGFVERLATHVTGGPWRAEGRVWFSIDRHAVPSQYLPKRSKGPPGGRASVASASWDFEPPSELSSLTLTTRGDDPACLVGVELTLGVAISNELFTTFEDTAWNAFGKTLKSRAKSGRR